MAEAAVFEHDPESTFTADIRAARTGAEVLARIDAEIARRGSPALAVVERDAANALPLLDAVIAARYARLPAYLGAAAGRLRTDDPGAIDVAGIDAWALGRLEDPETPIAFFGPGTGVYRVLLTLAGMRVMTMRWASAQWLRALLVEPGHPMASAARVAVAVTILADIQDATREDLAVGLHAYVALGSEANDRADLHRLLQHPAADAALWLKALRGPCGVDAVGALTNRWAQVRAVREAVWPHLGARFNAEVMADNLMALAEDPAECRIAFRAYATFDPARAFDALERLDPALTTAITADDLAPLLSEALDHDARLRVLDRVAHLPAPAFAQPHARKRAPRR